MKRTMILLMILSLALTATVSAEEYTVQDGDNLWKIADQYDTTIEAIALANDIKDINLIFKGQVLEIGYQSVVVEKNWEVDGFMQAESILYVPGHDWLYASNVNEQGAGYISKLSLDGKVEELKFVEGIPLALGLAYYDGHIYSASQNTVKVIDINSGEIVKELVAADGGMLNDITFSPDGDLYVTDFLSKKIYTSNGTSLETWYASDDFTMLNGIFFDYGDLLVSDMNMADLTGSIYRINVETKELSYVESMKDIGAIDGITKLGNQYLASNATTRELIAFTENSSEVIGVFEGGMADISVNTTTGEIYIPYLETNKVESYTIK